MRKPQTTVVFRVWASGSGKGEVIALFPDIDEGRGMCSSYEHVGQHGGADYVSVIQHTRPATPEEYKDLQRELTHIGYDLKIKTRRPVKHMSNDIFIYRSSHLGRVDDCSINVFHGRDAVAREEIVLKKKTVFGREYTYAEPTAPGSYAFGGTILFTSNGNFPEFNTPIKLHDRDMKKETN